jgi:glycosyltransferase involved in cell wall biosynthesis
VLWFVAEIMPRLDRLIGTDWRLVLAGSAGAARIQALAGPRIDLLGRVEDLARSFDRARISLAPARFAAGIPHKVHEAAAHGVPVVATPLLAQQLGWSDGIDLLAAADPAGFAERCAALYRDRVLWQGLRDAALARITVDCSETAFRRVVRQLVSEGAAPA